MCKKWKANGDDSETRWTKKSWKREGFRRNAGVFGSKPRAERTRRDRLPSIQKLPVTAVTWERAAQIRAAHKFQALDSIHLASAIENGCGLFLTNDAQLSRCTAIPIEVLT